MAVANDFHIIHAVTRSLALEGSEDTTIWVKLKKGSYCAWYSTVNNFSCWDLFELQKQYSLSVNSSHYRLLFPFFMWPWDLLSTISQASSLCRIHFFDSTRCLQNNKSKETTMALLIISKDCLLSQMPLLREYMGQIEYYFEKGN